MSKNKITDLESGCLPIHPPFPDFYCIFEQDGVWL
jgi:hypothetical protein